MRHVFTWRACSSCSGIRQAEYVLATLDSRPAAQLRARAHFAAGELRPPRRWLASCFAGPA